MPDPIEDNDQHLRWREVSARPVLDGHIFQVLSSVRVAADGAHATYTLVDSPDWCNIIATTEHNGAECIVMVRQFRHGNNTVTLELPGGVVDPGESASTAALRELREETGYTADSLCQIGMANPNPAFMNNITHTFVARGVRIAGGQDLDPNERVDVVLFPVEDLLELVPPEFHCHAIMLTALYWYRLYRQDGLDYQERLERWDKHSQGN